ncbi:MAG: hypothetical protein LJE62_02125 [Silicimonas sp.]|nr:hypothetical protein [Silicimonas sp.]
MTRLACLLMLLGAACAPVTPDDRTGVEIDRPVPGASEGGGSGLADVELCDASQYRPLVGQSVDATRFPTGPVFRVFGVNDIVTQDYVPHRTNVVYDASRVITRVYCG